MTLLLPYLYPSNSYMLGKHLSQHPETRLTILYRDMKFHLNRFSCQPPQITRFTCNFDVFEVKNFCLEMRIQIITDNMTKYTIQATKGIRQRNPIYFSFLLTFNEHIQLGQNQSFRELFNAWKNIYGFRVLGWWFQM